MTLFRKFSVVTLFYFLTSTAFYTGVSANNIPGIGYEFNLVAKSDTTRETPSKSLTIKGKRDYKNYLKTSYELSNYDEWLSSDDLYDNGSRYTIWTPLREQQTCQIDINGDGLEDIVYYDAYPLDIPLPNPPPSVFMNNGKVLEKIEWKGPSIINPHGSKLLLGDFNNDSLPDIFSLVAIDKPIGDNSGSQDICHLLFNSGSGFNSVKEFDDLKGFWHTGCSGDIDNDGDLDVVMINFAYWSNGVTSKILWNDGKGNFTVGTSGFSEIAPIHQSELFDLNNDGFLDLVFSYVSNHIKTTNDLIIMWGNGEDFSSPNSTSFTYPVNYYLWDIDFIDIDNDGIAEILLSEDNVNINEWESNDKYFIDLYKSDDKGKTFIKKTNQYFDINNMLFVNKMRVKDFDNNGKMDVYTSDRKDYIRWEWNGTKFIKIIPTGIKPTEFNNSIVINPNPSSGIFKIEGLSTNQQNTISIYTIDGRLIRKLISNSIAEIIDLSCHISGIYLLFVNNQPFKIIKG